MTTISPNRKRAAGVAVVARAPLSNILWTAGVPLLHLRESAATSFGRTFSSFGSNYAVATENDRLRAALASTTAALMDRDMLYAQNLELKSRLGRIPATDSVVLASVILRPPSSPYDTLMLDVGRRDGVAVGDLVAVSGSVYIGKIDEVYASSARVSLFSAPGSTYSALLIDQNATSSLAISVAGQGGGSLKAEVPLGTRVQQGDTVIFPTIMPEIVAHIVAVEEKTQGSFKILYMQLPVSIYGLQFVEVHRQPPHAAQ
jgi:cell shape-determining protein MreC